MNLTDIELEFVLVAVNWLIDHDDTDDEEWVAAGESALVKIREGVSR